MRKIRFASTRLQEAGKKGILTPDEHGYYQIPLGALNAYNSSGDYYSAERGVLDLFTKESAAFVRRMRNGNLKAEWGHPKMQPGMTDDEYLRRILDIHEPNVCAHIREIELDMDFGRNNPKFGNPNMIAILGWVKPSGPQSAAMESSFRNPHENVNFSIRAISTNEYQNGRCVRYLDTVVTFDAPTEQGIPCANKWDAPALESLVDIPVSRRALESIANDNRSIVATESSRVLAKEALKAFEKPVRTEVTLPAVPVYSRWGR